MLRVFMTKFCNFVRHFLKIGLIQSSSDTWKLWRLMAHISLDALNSISSVNSPTLYLLLSLVNNWWNVTILDLITARGSLIKCTTWKFVHPRSESLLKIERLLSLIHLGITIPNSEQNFSMWSLPRPVSFDKSYRVCEDISKCSWPAFPKGWTVLNLHVQRLDRISNWVL